MSDRKWDRRFLELARHISQWSKDPSTQVGAVIVDEKRRIVGMGYNGFPRGVEDRIDRYANKLTKYSLIVHAETNAILNANNFVEDCTIYIWPQFCNRMPPTCNECAKVIIQSGIKRVVAYAIGHRREEWMESLKIAREMYREAGVEVDYV